MFVPNTVSEQLLFTTIRIEAVFDEGVAPATGFGFSFPSGVVIVTNRHVLKDVIAIRLFFHEAGTDRHPTGNVRAVESSPEQWIGHPDSAIDLVVLPLATIEDAIKKAFAAGVYMPTLEPNNIFDDAALEKTLRVGEDLLMMGYPVGLFDSKHGLPVVRRGIAATPPWVDFGGNVEGLADVAMFGGSSGSPIFVLDEHVRINRKPQRGEALLQPGSRLILIGVAWGAAAMTQQGEIVRVTVPSMLESWRAQTQLMIHVAHYVKAKALLAFEACLPSAHAETDKEDAPNDGKA